jgi:cell division protein FtsQ
MWNDVATMRSAANLLFAVAGILGLYGVGHYVVHLPVFPVREVLVTGNTRHVTYDQVEAVISREVKGNFFTVDLAQARTAFEKLPWVRRVNVRRRWPDRLEFSVEEHRPIARWGSTALVSAQGEVFEAAINTVLPVFSGPADSAPDVVRCYSDFESLLAPLGKHVVQIRVSARRAWQLKLDDGMVVELGRESIESRLGAFAVAYGRTIGLMDQPPLYVDLRYSNGFAVRSLGLKWNPRKV